MAKEKLHFRFTIGKLAVCIEGGGGYGHPQMLDTVNLSIRSVNDKRKLGAREAVNFFVHRNEMAAIGMAFLDVARKMAPETTWARSETVGRFGSQQRPVVPLSMQEREDIDGFVKETGINLLRDPAASFDKMRRRMHILQRMQHLLERIEDGEAQQLDLLLTIMEQAGSLPFQIGVGEFSAAAHDDGSQPGTKH